MYTKNNNKKEHAPNTPKCSYPELPAIPKDYPLAKYSRLERIHCTRIQMSYEASWGGHDGKAYVTLIVPNADPYPFKGGRRRLL